VTELKNGMKQELFRDCSYFDQFTNEKSKKLLSKLEQDGNLISYAKKHFPDYVVNNEILKFNLVQDLNL